MNAAQLQKTLIDSGYQFHKTHDQQSEKNLWVVTDDDMIPIVSGHYLGEVIFKAAQAVGET